MDLPKPENTTCLISCNINGVRRGDDYQDLLEIAQSLKTSSIDITSFCETNIDWRSSAKSKLHEKFRRVYHHIKPSTSSNSIKYNTLYQPGGTITMAMDQYTGRITNQGSDQELGRWSFIEILGSQERKIIITTIYQVCTHGPRAGSRTADSQQQSLFDATAELAHRERPCSTTLTNKWENGFNWGTS